MPRSSPRIRAGSTSAGGPSGEDDRGDLIIDLRRVDQRDIALAGGKGANLGELIAAGLPVPPGFVVTTAAYTRFVAHGGLGETIARERCRTDGGAAIRAAFERTPVPPEVERQILAAYRRLGQGPVAVRSSATAEDLPEAAFAGQQETFLNIAGDEALLAAVRRCWASLWSDRAIAYRRRLGIGQEPVRLAVVVHRLVAAEVAGVMFTANPVTGRRDEIVINASPGLGEAVVAGLVTPDHYVLRKGSWWGWRVVERRPGRHEVLVRPRAGGGTEHAAPETETAPGTVMPDRVLRRLARYGHTIERHFGRPQDVEWAWTGDRLFIVQSRPVTALPAPGPRLSRAQQSMVNLVMEVLPVRPYPLEMATWGPELMRSVFFAPLLGLFGLAVDFGHLFAEEDGVVVRFRGQIPIRPTPAILLAPVRLIRQARRYDPARWHTDPLVAEAWHRARALEARDLRTCSWPDLLSTVHEALEIPVLVGEVRVRYLPRPMLAAAALLLVSRLLGRADLVATLLYTAVETKTLDANRTLAALAGRIRADPALAAAFAGDEPAALTPALQALPSGRSLLAELDEFLDRFGHREAGSLLLLSRSTWKDSPELVLGMLKGLARAEAPARLERASWEAARDELLAQPLLDWPPLGSALLRLLGVARRFHEIREDTHFDFTLPMPVLHRTIGEFGRRLVDAGVITTRTDVYFFKLGELDAGRDWPPSPDVAAAWRALVARRQATWAALAEVPLVDPRFRGQGAAAGDVLVRGTPGSPGVAVGPVRIIRDGAAFGTLRPGEVLVATYTNPSWTPLFQRAAAVVVDSGGAASHAAIVAREYGVPAVMGTGDGTHRLADGLPVRVDGTAGLVLRADRQPG